MNEPTPPENRGFFDSIVNLIGWLGFLGLFGVGVVGTVGAMRTKHMNQISEPTIGGALYLLVGGVAFALVIYLVSRRG